MNSDSEHLTPPSEGPPAQTSAWAQRISLATRLAARALPDYAVVPAVAPPVVPDFPLYPDRMVVCGHVLVILRSTPATMAAFAHTIDAETLASLELATPVDKTRASLASALRDTTVLLPDADGRALVRRFRAFLGANGAFGYASLVTRPASTLGAAAADEDLAAPAPTYNLFLRPLAARPRQPSAPGGRPEPGRPVSRRWDVNHWPQCIAGWLQDRATPAEDFGLSMEDVENSTCLTAVRGVPYVGLHVADARRAAMIVTAARAVELFVIVAGPPRDTWVVSIAPGRDDPAAHLARAAARHIVDPHGEVVWDAPALSADGRWTSVITAGAKWLPPHTWFTVGRGAFTVRVERRVPPSALTKPAASAAGPAGVPGGGGTPAPEQSTMGARRIPMRHPRPDATPAVRGAAAAGPATAQAHPAVASSVTAIDDPDPLPAATTAAVVATPQPSATRAGRATSRGTGTAAADTHRPPSAVESPARLPRGTPAGRGGGASAGRGGGRNSGAGAWQTVGRGGRGASRVSRAASGAAPGPASGDVDMFASGANGTVSRAPAKKRPRGGAAPETPLDPNIARVVSSAFSSAVDPLAGGAPAFTFGATNWPDAAVPAPPLGGVAASSLAAAAAATVALHGQSDGEITEACATHATSVPRDGGAVACAAAAASPPRRVPQPLVSARRDRQPAGRDVPAGHAEAAPATQPSDPGDESLVTVNGKLQRRPPAAAAALAASASLAVVETMVDAVMAAVVGGGASAADGVVDDVAAAVAGGGVTAADGMAAQGKKRARWYAVLCGRQPGLYEDWITSGAQTSGFPGAIHQSFASRAEATRWMADHGVGTDGAPLAPGAAHVPASSSGAEGSRRHPDDLAAMASPPHLRVRRVERGDPHTQPPFSASPEGGCAGGGGASVAGAAQTHPLDHPRHESASAAGAGLRRGGDEHPPPAFGASDAFDGAQSAAAQRMRGASPQPRVADHRAAPHQGQSGAAQRQPTKGLEPYVLSEGSSDEAKPRVRPLRLGAAARTALPTPTAPVARVSRLDDTVVDVPDIPSGHCVIAPLAYHLRLPWQTIQRAVFGHVRPMRADGSHIAALAAMFGPILLERSGRIPVLYTAARSSDPGQAIAIPAVLVNDGTHIVTRPTRVAAPMPHALVSVAPLNWLTPDERAAPPALPSTAATARPGAQARLPFAAPTGAALGSGTAHSARTGPQPPRSKLATDLARALHAKTPFVVFPEAAEPIVPLATWSTLPFAFRAHQLRDVSAGAPAASCAGVAGGQLAGSSAGAAGAAVARPAAPPGPAVVTGAAAARRPEAPRVARRARTPPSSAGDEEDAEDDSFLAPDDLRDDAEAGLTDIASSSSSAASGVGGGAEAGTGGAGDGDAAESSSSSSSTESMPETSGDSSSVANDQRSDAASEGGEAGVGPDNLRASQLGPDDLGVPAAAHTTSSLRATQSLPTIVGAPPDADTALLLSSLASDGCRARGTSRRRERSESSVSAASSSTIDADEPFDTSCAWCRVPLPAAVSGALCDTAGCSWALCAACFSDPSQPLLCPAHAGPRHRAPRAGRRRVAIAPAPAAAPRPAPPPIVAELGSLALLAAAVSPARAWDIVAAARRGGAWAVRRYLPGSSRSVHVGYAASVAADAVHSLLAAALDTRRPHDVRTGARILAFHAPLLVAQRSTPIPLQVERLLVALSGDAPPPPPALDHARAHDGPSSPEQAWARRLQAAVASQQVRRIVALLDDGPAPAAPSAAASLAALDTLYPPQLDAEPPDEAVMLADIGTAGPVDPRAVTAVAARDVRVWAARHRGKGGDPLGWSGQIIYDLNRAQLAIGAQLAELFSLPPARLRDSRLVRAVFLDAQGHLLPQRGKPRPRPIAAPTVPRRIVSAVAARAARPAANAYCCERGHVGLARAPHLTAYSMFPRLVLEIGGDVVLQDRSNSFQEFERASILTGVRDCVAAGVATHRAAAAAALAVTARDLFADASPDGSARVQVHFRGLGAGSRRTVHALPQGCSSSPTLQSVTLATAMDLRTRTGGGVVVRAAHDDMFSAAAPGAPLASLAAPVIACGGSYNAAKSKAIGPRAAAAVEAGVAAAAVPHALIFGVPIGRPEAWVADVWVPRVKRIARAAVLAADFAPEAAIGALCAVGGPGTLGRHWLRCIPAGPPGSAVRRALIRADIAWAQAVAHVAGALLPQGTCGPGSALWSRVYGTGQAALGMHAASEVADAAYAAGVADAWPVMAAWARDGGFDIEELGRAVGAPEEHLCGPTPELAVELWADDACADEAAALDELRGRAGALAAAAPVGAVESADPARPNWLVAALRCGGPETGVIAESPSAARAVIALALGLDPWSALRVVPPARCMHCACLTSAGGGADAGRRFEHVLACARAGRAGGGKRRHDDVARGFAELSRAVGGGGHLHDRVIFTGGPRERPADFMENHEDRPAGGARDVTIGLHCIEDADQREARKWRKYAPQLARHRDLGFIPMGFDLRGGVGPGAWQVMLRWISLRSAAVSRVGSCVGDARAFIVGSVSRVLTRAVGAQIAAWCRVPVPGGGSVVRGG